MEIWAGFLIGLVGGFHCIGMCGPIVVALPGESKKFRFLIGKLAYNFGRIVTYSTLGLLSGFIGERVAIAGYQSALSITIGVILLLAFIIPGSVKRRVFGNNLFSGAGKRVKIIWGKLFGIRTLSSLFAIGILNGFLPCGLVYVALAGAIAVKDPIGGMLYMAAFGIGTIPLLLALSLVGNIVSLKLKQTVTRLIPVGAVILATLFILRGLSLGIPYISPKRMVTAKGTTMECCKPASTSADTTANSSH